MGCPAEGLICGSTRELLTAHHIRDQCAASSNSSLGQRETYDARRRSLFMSMPASQNESEAGCLVARGCRHVRDFERLASTKHAHFCLAWQATRLASITVLGVVYLPRTEVLERVEIFEPSWSTVAESVAPLLDMTA